MKHVVRNTVLLSMSLVLGLAVTARLAWARDVEYSNSEVNVNVSPGEPTQIQFPGKIAGGFKKKSSAVSIERKDDTLIVFAGDNMPSSGEAILVRLEDGRSYSMRIMRASAASPRDPTVSIKDERGSIIAGSEEEEPAYREKNFEYAPPNQVSGLMREMILAMELGKKAIAGYRVSDQYSGEVVLDDGTIRAKVDKIFIGPNLWGYVLSAENMLDQSQKLNPASFRLDGTRAISFTNWELAARPLNVEQQISGKDKTKVYIVTRARKAG